MVLLAESSRNQRGFFSSTMTQIMKGSKRRYVVAMNCQRGNIPVENVLKKFQEVISSKIFYRSALILGINEKVTMKNSINSLPTFKEVLSEENISILKNLNIPVMVVYYQWTAYRDLKQKEDNLTAQQVRQLLFMLTEFNPKLLQNVLDEDEELNHTFPFGQARNFLLSNDDSQNFILSLHQNDCQVNIHIQDSDVVSYQQNPMFTDFLLGDNPLIPRKTEHLLDKFDILIDHIEKQNGFPPLFVGGAHTYSPAEDLSALEDVRFNTWASKLFTRLVSEVSNTIRHFVGQQHPYGIYFHEPNCLVLSPPSARRMLMTRKHLPNDIKKAYARLAKAFKFGLDDGEMDQLVKGFDFDNGEEKMKEISRLAQGFKFGHDSELQGFTREVFESLNDEACRMGMIFSASIVLATSMKRGNGKTFTVEFDGKFNPGNGQFRGWQMNPLTGLNEMSQEVVHTNKWKDMIATSFTSHLKSNAANFIIEAWNLFVPKLTESISFLPTDSEEEQKN
jgi:hypothetical protein